MASTVTTTAQQHECILYNLIPRYPLTNISEWVSGDETISCTQVVLAGI